MALTPETQMNRIARRKARANIAGGVASTLAPAPFKNISNVATRAIVNKTTPTAQAAPVTQTQPPVNATSNPNDNPMAFGANQPVTPAPVETTTATPVVTPAASTAPIAQRTEPNDVIMQRLQGSAQTQQELDDLTAQRNREITAISGQGRGITTPFVQGQQAIVQNLANQEVQALETKLTREQEAEQFAREQEQQAFENSLALAKLGNGTSSSFDYGISPITGKPFTGEQSKAATFASRVNNAEQVLSGGRGKFLPLVPKFLRPQDRREFEQAENNFITAILRRESGAAIAPSEFADAREVYIPRATDDVNVLKQKAQNREIALQGLINESVGGFEQIQSQVGNSQNPAPSTGVTSSGISYTIEQ